MATTVQREAKVIFLERIRVRYRIAFGSANLGKPRLGSAERVRAPDSQTCHIG